MSARATRRQFLAGAGWAAALVLLGGPRASATARRGPTFAEPAVLDSAGGQLAVTLRAAPVDLPYGSGTRYALAYNGSVPGPTLRVRPGDRLTVHLENGLERPTNLHTHGLHVHPSADDVFTEVAPGGVRTYVYDIPATHPAGLFWYHPHVHPWVAEQVGAGLAGALVVVDDAVPPALAGATERLLVLADPPVGPTAAALEVTAMEQLAGREGDVVLVNGVRAPLLDSTAGTLERWRVLNASPSRFYRLAVDGHTLHQIGSDQGLFTAAQTVDTLLLAPGERADLLVTPTRAGRFRVRALPYDRGRPQGMGSMPGATTRDRDAVLATMRVSGRAPSAPVPTALPGRPLAVPAADTTRLVDLAMAMTAMHDSGGMGGTGGTRAVGDVFTINGKTFDPDRVDVAPPLGSTQEWVIRNATTMDHPIHLHTWPFRVVSRSDDVEPEPGWKDTVNVPAGAEVRIRIPFVDYIGRSVYHCHILDHEDLGMMATVDVR